MRYHTIPHDSTRYLTRYHELYIYIIFIYLGYRVVSCCCLYKTLYKIMVSCEVSCGIVWYHFRNFTFSILLFIFHLIDLMPFISDISKNKKAKRKKHFTYLFQMFQKRCHFKLLTSLSLREQYRHLSLLTKKLKEGLKQKRTKIFNRAKNKHRGSRVTQKT